MELAFDFVWLIPLFPLTAFVLIAFGLRKNEDLSSYVTIGALSLSLILGLIVLAGVITYPGGPGHLAEHPYRVNFPFLFGTEGWMPLGTESLNIGFMVDPLAAVMIFVVTVVGLNIFVYSRGYMHGDPRFSRFFAFLALFAMAMLMLVIADNLLLLFISWELVGLCSYFLIGFWFEKKSAADAGMKAFIVTRIGDVGLYLGLLMLFVLTGHLDFGGIFHSVEELVVENPTLVTIAAVLVFCGAVGKSAQFPLHVWLPDAMEGPTPVSALIHAATMVAAGVYLVARMFPLFEAGLHGHGMTPAMEVVAFIGAFTAIFAATIAVAQNDIKRVLAYSTISQLGYMIMGLGVGALVAAVFHLMTHAFFKALLFLGSGSVIHGCGGEQDMIKMGGLRKKMPITFWTFMAGTLALAGIFPFAGFWSKDEILHHALSTHLLAYILGAVAAFLTAFYMTRQVGLTFLGEPRDHSIHAHESPPVMWVPLAILAFFATVLGLVGLPLDLLGGAPGHLFSGFLLAHPHAVPADLLFMGFSLLIAIVGIGAGWFVYVRRPLRAGEPDPLSRWLGPVYTVLKNKYYFDELYKFVFIDRTIDLTKALAWFDTNVIDRIVNAVGWATDAFARALSWVDVNIVDRLVNAVGRAAIALSGGLRWVDVNIVDGLVDAFGALTTYTGDVLRVLQTGKVQNYALIALTGLLFLAGYFIYVLYR